MDNESKIRLNCRTIYHIDKGRDTQYHHLQLTNTAKQLNNGTSINQKGSIYNILLADIYIFLIQKLVVHLIHKESQSELIPTILSVPYHLLENDTFIRRVIIIINKYDSNIFEYITLSLDGILLLTQQSKNNILILKNLGISFSFYYANEVKSSDVAPLCSLFNLMFLDLFNSDKIDFFRVNSSTVFHNLSTSISTIALGINNKNRLAYSQALQIKYVEGIWFNSTKNYTF